MRAIINLLLFVGIGITGYSQPEWREYVFDSQNFKIDFFQQPEFSADTSVFSDSPLISHFWECKVDDPSHDNVYYNISRMAYPSDFIHSDSLFTLVDGFIGSTQNSLINDDNFTLLSSYLVEKRGYPGKVFKWKSNANDLFLEFHVYLVENKLFELSAVTREGKNHNPDLTRYFDSFEIINIRKGNYTLPVQAKERSIQIKFPEVPEEQTKTVDSEYGKLALDIQILEPETAEDNLVYIAMETKYPAGAVDQEDTTALNTFYEKAIDGSLNSVNGEFISMEDIYFNNNPGKEFRCYVSDGNALMVYRYFLVDNSFYSFGVITLPEKDRNEGMIAFFDSFGIK